ncbi:hypothetical protein V8E53_007983 [Lactarius tabidus]
MSFPTGLLDSYITEGERILLALPRSLFCPAFAGFLAIGRFTRYKVSDQKDDLDKAILHFTKSILGPWVGPNPNIPRAFSNLACALLERSKVYKQPEDASHAANYLRHLCERHKPDEKFGIPRHRVTKLLVDALAVQVKLEAGNAMQIIEEMAVLLLTLDISNVDTTHTIDIFVEAALSKTSTLLPQADQPLDQIIECLRAVRKHQPGLHTAHLVLFHCLSRRYEMTFVDDDYKEAVSVLEEIIASSPPGYVDDRLAAEAQECMVKFAIRRSTVFRTPESSEEAIYRAHALLGSSYV